MEVLIGALIVFLATSTGAAVVFFFPSLNERRNAAMLAFASGAMAYSSVEMLSESHESAGDIVVLAGFVLGLAVLMVLERTLPHIHLHITKKELMHSKKKALMIGGAIALHNVPEGFAIAAAFAASSPLGWFVTTTLAIQDAPEGALVSAPLAAYGMKPWKAASYGMLSGAAEAVSALGGFLLLNSFSALIPLSLAFSAGAMAYVVLVELLPDAFRKGMERTAAVSFAGGAAAAFVIAGLLAL